MASFLGFLWEKEGATIDPYGLSGNGQATGTGETGGSIDPYGGR